MRLSALFTLLIAALMLSSCATHPRISDGAQYRNVSKKDPKGNFRVGQTWIGVASYYGKEHHGNRTASGAIFDMDKISSAHKYLPFGTRIKVVNLKNRKSIELTINDRGPFTRGRMLDVSLGAARELDMVRDGLVEVQVTIISLPKG